MGRLDRGPASAVWLAVGLAAVLVIAWAGCGIVQQLAVLSTGR